MTSVETMASYHLAPFSPIHHVSKIRLSSFPNTLYRYIQIISQVAPTFKVQFLPIDDAFGLQVRRHTIINMSYRYYVMEGFIVQNHRGTVDTDTRHRRIKSNFLNIAFRSLCHSGSLWTRTKGYDGTVSNSRQLNIAALLFKSVQCTRSSFSLLLARVLRPCLL